MLAEQRQQLRELERLGHVVARPAGDAALPVVLVRARREEDQRDARGFRVRPQLPEHAVAVHPGHQDIADDDVRPPLPRGGDTACAVPDGDHAVALGLQQPLEIGADRRFVLDYEHRGHRQSSGIVTRKRVPVPGLLSTLTLPRWRSSDFLTMASPSPVPVMLPTLRARWNVSNSRGWSSGGMPMPLSFTSNTASFAWTCTRNSTVPPAGVYLKALASRLAST